MGAHPRHGLQNLLWPVLWMLAVSALAAIPHVCLASGGANVSDVPDDDGTALVVKWNAALAGDSAVTIYRGTVLAKPTGYEPAAVSALREVATVPGKLGEFIDSGLSRDSLYVYRVAPASVGGPVPTLPVKPRASIINRSRINQLLIFVAFVAAVLVYIRLAASGKKFFVRRIAGLTAIEEAIGRATEMGKPVLYVPGIDDMDNIQTIASMVILKDVARLAGTYDTPIIVPVCRPFVVPVAEEAVKQGFLSAGKPELYNPNNVRYLSDEQFAFTAGIAGIMMREGTVANLYMGSFFAESLILAETGFSTGAIQIAGTANVHQLPFFVAACDYTLIGEELYAVSAYLSKEPKLLGTLKASDLAKLVILILLVAGFIASTAGFGSFAAWFLPR
jgi:hypothetical protein